MSSNFQVVAFAIKVLYSLVVISREFDNQLPWIKQVVEELVTVLSVEAVTIQQFEDISEREFEEIGVVELDKRVQETDQEP